MGRAQGVTVVQFDRAAVCVTSGGASSQAIPYDKDIYQERNLIERFFNKIKRFRRIATRYDKTAVSLAASYSWSDAVIWLR